MITTFPEGDELIVEAYLPEQGDVRICKINQDGIIKLEPYSFMR